MSKLEICNINQLRPVGEDAEPPQRGSVGQQKIEARIRSLQSPDSIALRTSGAHLLLERDQDPAEWELYQPHDRFINGVLKTHGAVANRWRSLDRTHATGSGAVPRCGKTKGREIHQRDGAFPIQTSSLKSMRHFLVSRVRVGFHAFFICGAQFDSLGKSRAASAMRWANLRALENDAQARMRMKRSSPRSSLSTS